MLPIKAVFCIVDTRKHFEKSRGHLYLYIRGYYSYSTPLDRALCVCGLVLVEFYLFFCYLLIYLFSTM